MRNIFLLVFTIFVFSSVFSQSDEEVQAMLFKASQKINENLPMTVDSETRLDNIIPLSKRTIQYNYTLVNTEKEYFDKNIVDNEYYPVLLNDVKTNPGLKIFRDINITLVYNYRDKNGKFLLKYIFPPKKYKSIESNQTSLINSNNDFNTSEFVDYVNFKDHPKAKGVNIKLKYPNSFERKEGARPNVISNFVHKTKNLNFNLVIGNTPSYLSRNEIKQVFEQDSEILAKELVKEIEAELISSRYVEIDNYQAIESIIKLNLKSVSGENIISDGILWNIFYEDKLITISSGYVGDDFEEAKRLLRLIMNTIIFEEQYDYAGSSRVYFNDNFNEFVDKFFRELNFYGINKTRPKNIRIRLLPFDQFNKTSHIHGASFGYNKDDIIDIVLNERSWNEFTKAQKHYLIFHELSHDILNLDDLSASENEKQIMYPSIHNFKNLTMDDFIDNFHSLLENYNSVDSIASEEPNYTKSQKDPLISLEMKNFFMEKHLLELKNKLGSREYYKLQTLYNLDEYARCIVEKLLEKFSISELENMSESNKIVEDMVQSCLDENEKSTDYVNNTLETELSSVEAYNNSGVSKNNLENYDEAIIDLTKAIELDPNYSAAYYNRGISKLGLKDYNGAIIDFSKAIEIEPDFVNAYINRGLANGNLKDYNKAISNYSKAIELDPKNTLAYSNRGDAKNNLEDYYGAIIDLTKAIELDSNYVDAYNNRGNSKLGLKDYNGAILEYNKAIELDSNYSAAYYNRGISKYFINDTNGACEDAKKSESLGLNASSLTKAVCN